MRLISFYHENGCLVIHTDKGDRKVMLTWRGIAAIEEKCKKFIGKKIRHTTYGNYDPEIWFSDIFLDEQDTSSLNIDSLNQIPTNFVFNEHKVTKIYGPPGTGKTAHLIQIVQYAIKAGVDPQHIAFLSFTNAAADEAQARVADAFPDLGSISFPFFSTIHSLSTRIGGALNKTLCEKKHINQFDLNINCEDEWLKSGDASSVVVRFKHPIMDMYCLSLAKCEEFSPPDFVSKNQHHLKILDALSDFFKVNNDLLQQKFSFYIKNYIEQYLAFKNNNNLADFNDVILNVITPDFESRLPTFELLIIDEAQDLSDLQWAFINKLIPKAKDVYVAGDDDQAIMINFGASSHAFLELEGDEKILPQSYRVPKEVTDYVNAGVIHFLKQLPNRKEKEWLPANHSGMLTSRTIHEEIQVDSDTNEYKKIKVLSNFDITDLLSEIQNTSNEEWLIMAPTRSTGQEISAGLEQLNVPHFYRNQPRANATRTTRVNIRSIHTSKGLGADNVAIVVRKFGDVIMLASDPRLAYVALTRAKKHLYPRVTKDKLLPDMLGSKSAVFRDAARTYMQMFPISNV
jgi:superfamily I DNA/RNA helicase